MKKRIFLLLVVLLCSSTDAFSQSPEESPPLLSDTELEELIAPIALYPDPLLAQVLPASTYPLDIVQAARIIHGKNDFSKIDSQNWDESVKAVARYPSILKKMNEKLDWTEQLGEAVLNQQEDVMKAIQRKREQAKGAGNLKSTPQQIVEQNDQIIEILPPDPKIIYVPVYDPEIVYVVPRVPIVRPIIHFESAFPIGSWLNIGFYWPTRSLFHCDSGWWREERRSAHHYNVHNTVIVNRIYKTRVERRVWTHNNRHWDRYHGRNHFPNRPSPRPYPKGPSHPSGPTDPTDPHNTPSRRNWPRSNEHARREDGRHFRGGMDPWRNRREQKPPQIPSNTRVDRPHRFQGDFRRMERVQNPSDNSPQLISKRNESIFNGNNKIERHSGGFSHSRQFRPSQSPERNRKPDRLF